MDLKDHIITYSSESPIYQRIILILKKFELFKHVPKEIDVNSYNKNEILIFDHKSYLNDTNIVLKNSKNNLECTLRYNRYSGFELTYDSIPIFFETSDYNNYYFKHLKNYKNKIELNGSLKILLDRESKELKNYSRAFKNLKFFEENINTTLKLLCSCALFNNDLRRFHINVNEFGRLQKYSDLLKDIALPTMNAVNEFIENIKFIKKFNLNNTVNSFLFSTTILQDNFYNSSTTEKLFKICSISLSGLPIIKEHSVEKYKYIFHPGIYLSSYLLEHTNKFNEFKNAFDKNIFKVI